MGNINNFKLDFVGVGFPRSGTTWIARCLAKNEALALSEYKEMHYFIPSDSNVFGENSKFKELRPSTYEDYVSKFKNNGTPQGEISVHYIYEQSALQEIKKKYPEVKVILCIRDPIDYLESAFNFVKSSHVGYKFSENMLKEVEKAPMSRMFSIKRAYFYKYVKNCKEIFGNNLLIIKFEDIENSPETALKMVYSFLEIPFSEEHLVTSKVNPSRAARSPLLMKFIHTLVKFIEKTPLKTYLFTVVSKDNYVQKVFNLLFKKDADKKYKFNDEERTYLNKLLKEDQQKLNQLISF